MTIIGVPERALGNALDRLVVFDKVYEPIKTGDVPTTYHHPQKHSSQLSHRKPVVPLG